MSWLSRFVISFSPVPRLRLGAPAFAASSKSDPSADIQALQRAVADLNNQLQQVKRAQADLQAGQANSDNSAALVDLKRSTSDQYADLSSQITTLGSSQDKPSVNNGRLQITSADGRFSAAVRVLVQYDTAIYSQTHAANLLPTSYAPDFSSGSNFRRIYLGVSGKLFGDWTYNANFDFGGSGGTETPGHVQSVYVEYDGLGAWAFRIGAFPPPTNIEDGTSSGDTIFLERNSPSDLQRNLAGGDGRDAVSIIYTAPTLYGAVSYTGDKVSDGAKALAAAGATASPTFGEQQAVVGRASWLAVASPMSIGLSASTAPMSSRSAQRHVRTPPPTLPPRRAAPRPVPSPCPIRPNSPLIPTVIHPGQYRLACRQPSHPMGRGDGGQLAEFLWPGRLLRLPGQSRAGGLRHHQRHPDRHPDQQQFICLVCASQLDSHRRKPQLRSRDRRLHPAQGRPSVRSEGRRLWRLGIGAALQ